MLSPSRNQYPVALSDLQRRVADREAINRMHGGSSAATTRDAQGSVANVDGALASASETLRRVEAQSLIGQRDIASISVEAQRALAARDARLHESEHALKTQGLTVQELDDGNAAAGAQLAGGRRRLADMQVSVDGATDQVQRGHAALSDLVRKVEAAAASFDVLATTAKNERDDLEKRVAAAEQASRRLQDEIKVAIAMRGPAATAHSERSSDIRRRLEALRRDIDNKKAELGAVCTGLDDCAKQSDDAQRRFAKSQDERVNQFISDRRATTQTLNSERHERERTIRAATEAAADELRAKVSAQSDALAAFKEVEAKAISREMELHDALARGKEKLVGKSALDARLNSVEATAFARNMEIRQLEEECAAGRDRTQQLSNQIASYENTLAPLPDVEASVRQHTAQAASRQQEIAERTADHALWQAKHTETSGVARRQLDAAMAQIDDKARKRTQTLAEIELEANAAREAQRGLEDQLRHVDLELQEVQQRNALADRRLETAAAEHEREEQEARRRKDTARQAAAHLLASLAE